MKRILINATQKEELRVAIVDGQKLIDLDIETSSAGRKKGNIYKGVIARVEPGLDAVFVDYGDPKHGFLPFREISQAYFKNRASGGRNDSSSVARALHQGQALLVQVQREGHGGKGAALTTFISLAGRCLVLMPNNPRAGGVSRRMDDRERDATRQTLSQLSLRDEEGIIIRTKGAGSDIKLLQRDLDYLRKLWESVVSAAKTRAAPYLVYEESNIVICALRDHFSDDTEEVIVDNEEVFGDARDFIKLVIPQYLDKLKLHQEPTPLFNHYQIESQIEMAFDREITLPSGGSIVLDRTEALLSIDINSGKATKGRDIEETALNTNLEAAEEISRQLRLRDIGGLIVIDFIDMMPLANRKAVENRLHQLTRQDAARVQFERISRFGLLEMSRQRMRPSLSESSHIVCPRCVGKGFIRTLESSALSTLRMMEEEAAKEKSGRVVAQLPLEITSFLLNEKRGMIKEIENRHKVELMIVPDPKMQIPHFQIRRYRTDDRENQGKYSYEMITERKTGLAHSPQRTNGGAREKPAVKDSALDFMEAKKAPGARTKGKFLNLVSTLFRKEKAGKDTAEETGVESRDTDRQRRSRGGRHRGGRPQDQRRSDSSRRQDHRSQAPGFQPPGGERERRPADSRRDGESQRRGSGRSHRSRQSSSYRRSTTPVARGGRRNERQPDTPAMTPPPYAVDQPPDTRSAPQSTQRNAPRNAPDNAPRNAPHNAPDNAPDNAPGNAPSNAPSNAPRNAPSNAPGNAPSNAPSNAPGNAPRNAPADRPGGGGTVFTPPMPTLPENPPPKTNGNADSKPDATAATPRAPKAPEASPVPLSPAPAPASPLASRPGDAGKAQQPTEAPTPDSAQDRQPAAPAAPPAYSPPRFSKPDNLVQIETREPSADQD